MPGPNDPSGDADKAFRAPEPPQSPATGERNRQASDSEAAGAEPGSTGSGPLDGEK
jgi:hypothetical protein